MSLMNGEYKLHYFIVSHSSGSSSVYLNSLEKILS